jgi:hypothetical protein
MYPVGEGTRTIAPGEYAYTLNYLIDDKTLINRALNTEYRWKTYVESQFDVFRYIWENTNRGDTLGQALATTFSWLGSTSSAVASR